MAQPVAETPSASSFPQPLEDAANKERCRIIVVSPTLYTDVIVLGTHRHS